MKRIPGKEREQVSILHLAIDLIHYHMHSGCSAGQNQILLKSRDELWNIDISPQVPGPGETEAKPEVA